MRANIFTKGGGRTANMIIYISVVQSNYSGKVKRETFVKKGMEQHNLSAEFVRCMSMPKGMQRMCP
jgi:hypothetical protein